MSILYFISSKKYYLPYEKQDKLYWQWRKKIKYNFLITSEGVLCTIWRLKLYWLELVTLNTACYYQFSFKHNSSKLENNLASSHFYFFSSVFIIKNSLQYQCCKGGKLFPYPFNATVWIMWIKLTKDGLTGENVYFLCTQGLHRKELKPHRSG